MVHEPGSGVSRPFRAAVVGWIIAGLVGVIAIIFVASGGGSQYGDLLTLAFAVAAGVAVALGYQIDKWRGL